MASFLTDLVKPFVEKLINGVIAESSYICCFTCIAKDFEEEKARLETERATFERRIEDATRRGEDVLPDTLAWKDEVDQLIQEDTKQKQKCFFEFCPHCLWRYSRGKLLANKKERIKTLMETGKKLTIGVPAHLPDIERCTTQHYVHLKSRESRYRELLDKLKDDNNYIIGLHGMGGIGKTTLITKVGKDLKLSKQFSLVIVTTVSFSPNIKKIQDDIAGPLGLKFDDCNDTERRGKLWNRLTNGEKILLILDDVWGDVDFNEIGIPCSDNHKGCRIIVTTRNRSVCDKLRCNKKIQLDLLSKEDAWNMFKKYADLSETSTQFFLDKGRKIANECKNLPIAIAVIASSLKGKQRQEEWDMALKFLKNDISRHNDDDDVIEIYKCLKFSYDKLNEEAKSLFLLCSVFREDEDIDTERLARLAIAGGLFGEDYDSYDEARSRVVKSKIRLLDSCLLLEADQRSVKMHDFARDAAQWIANKEIQTRKVYDKSQKATLESEKNIKYLLCEGKPNEVFSCKFDGSKLEILIVIIDMAYDAYDDREFEVSDSFFENNTSLRVFHLRDEIFCRRISLPQSMQQLKNIRSLIFIGCNLGDISIFGNLQSLEELDLDHCQINEMPDGITKLEKFRLLRLEWCKIYGNNPFEVIERCSSLQELYFRNSFNQFCREITFPKLQRFHVVHDYGIDYSTLSKYVSLEKSNELSLSETTLKYCMQEAEVLRLRRIEGEWRNIIPDIVHMDQGTSDLVELDLSFISQLKCLIDTTKHTHSQVSNVFSKLVVLRLSYMDNLEELCNGSLSVDSLKSLEILSIRNCKQLRILSGIANQCNLKSVSLRRCPMLISLFEVSTSGSLVLFEKLEVIDCENLEYLIKDERIGEGSRREMLEKLEYLTIENCPKLEIMLPLVSAHDLPALKSIKVKRCDKLKYIFGQDVEFGSLERMELSCVPNLIGIFPECNRTTSFSINNRSSPISISASKAKTQSDPIKCSILSWTDMYCCGKKLRSTTNTKIPLIYENQPQGNSMDLPSLVAICPKQYHTTLPLLKELVLRDCLWAANKKSIGDFMKELSGSMEDLLALEKLKLTNFKLESIFCVNEVNEQQMNLGLQNIYLVNLNVMVYPFVGPKNSFALLNLTQITIMRCGKLQIIFPASILRCLPQLDELMISECEELKHIFEDDLENQNMSDSSSSSTTCFPKLKVLSVENCNKLKYVFPISICNELPELKVLVITEAKELEEIFKSSEGEGIEKVRIPNLKLVAIFGLPSLFQTQEIQFQAVEHRFMKDCDKLSLTTTLTIEILFRLFDGPPDNFEIGGYLYRRLRAKVEAASKDKSTSPQVKIKQTQETDQEFVENVVGLVTPSVEILPTNSKASMNEQSVDQQCPLKETDATVTPSKGIEISVEKEPTSANAKTITSSTRLELGTKISVEHGTTSTNSKARTSSNPVVTSEDNSSSQAPMNEQLVDQQSLLEERDAIITPSEIRIKQTQETDQEFVENVFGLVTPSVAILPTNSKALMTGQSVDQQSPLEKTDAIVTPSQLEGSMSEKAVAGILSTISGLENESIIQLVAPKQKGIEISNEEETTSTNDRTQVLTSVVVIPMPLGILHSNIAAAITELINEQSTTQQKSFGESHTTIKPSQRNNGSTPEQIAAATLSTISETKNESLIQLVSAKQKNDIKTSVEGRTASSNAKTLTSSTSKLEEPSHASMNERSVDQQCPLEEKDAIVTPSQDIMISVEGGTSSSNAKTLSPPTSQCEKPSHVMEITVEHGTTSTNSKENDNGQTKSFSISTKQPLAMEVVDHGGSQETNQIKHLGDTSQIGEDLGSSLLVRRELEQLVSEKHLNYETLSLLTDFLLKHPSVLLKDTLLTNRYKGYAYNCLAELLKFLQTHSVLDVLGSSHSEFVGLIQDVRKFSFNKDWLDGVEKRALFSNLQFSRDAMQKLLDSKKQVIKEVEEMRLKLHFFNHHVEDIKHQLTSSEVVLASIIQQEEQVLETTAALSVPLGY